MSCKEHLRPLCNKAIVHSNNKETVPLTIFFFPLEKLQCRLLDFGRKHVDVDFSEYCKNYMCACISLLV